MGLGEAGANAAAASSASQAQVAAPPTQPGATDQQFGAVNTGCDRGALLVSLPVQVLDNGKLRVEQVELYERDDADDVARVFCINHRIGDPECAKLLEALKQRRTAAVGNTQQPGGQQMQQQQQQQMQQQQQQQQAQQQMQQ